MIQVARLMIELIQQGPIQKESVIDNAQFVHYASELIALSTNAPRPSVKTETFDHTMRKIEKSRIVARTQISYPQTELLKLITHHLLTQVC